VAALVIGQGIMRVSTEQAAITPVIDQFMRAMVQRDADGAFRIFSTRAQRQTALADLTDMVEGPNYVLFEGYQSVTIDNTNISTVMNTNPDIPQGTVATVTGTVTYTGDVKGEVRATLEKEEGTWRLFFINVIVPPSKMQVAP
jgi:hypothetical protein